VHIVKGKLTEKSFVYSEIIPVTTKSVPRDDRGSMKLYLSFYGFKAGKNLIIKSESEGAGQYECEGFSVNSQTKSNPKEGKLRNEESVSFINASAHQGRNMHHHRLKRK